ncbi:14273_t:CDS:2, partial [Acaulospora colombiana]
PNEDEDRVNPDERKPQRLWDKRIQRDDEFSDSDDEGEGGRKFRSNGDVEMDISAATTIMTGDGKQQTSGNKRTTVETGEEPNFAGSQMSQKRGA